MISIEFGNYKIQKEKESYSLVDKNISLGDGNVSYKNVDGETQIQDIKIRKDGHIKQYGIRILCSYEEKEVLRKIMLGKNKTKRCNAAILTISEGNSRDVMVKVVAGDSGFYEETAIIEDIEDLDVKPAQYGYNDMDILYEVDILLVKVK